MEESIYLYSRGDRLGSHLIQYLSIIIYAFYNNLYIVYDPKKVNYNSDYEYEGNNYRKSFIVESLLVWIDNYNTRFPKRDYESKYKNINIMEYLLEFEIKHFPCIQLYAHLVMCGLYCPLDSRPFYFYMYSITVGWRDTALFCDFRKRSHCCRPSIFL